MLVKQLNSKISASFFLKISPRTDFLPFKTVSHSAALQKDVFNNQQNNHHAATNTEQTRRGNLIELIRGDLITPSCATWCLSASHRGGKQIWRGGTYLPSRWRHQRAIKQTNYEINKVGLQVCVSLWHPVGHGTDYVLAACLMALFNLVLACCACAAAVLL